MTCQDQQLNSMTFQAWKMTSLNSMTFQVFHDLYKPSCNMLLEEKLLSVKTYQDLMG